MMKSKVDGSLEVVALEVGARELDVYIYKYIYIYIYIYTYTYIVDTNLQLDRLRACNVVESKVDGSLEVVALEIGARELDVWLGHHRLERKGLHGPVVENETHLGVHLAIQGLRLTPRSICLSTYLSISVYLFVDLPFVMSIY